MAAGTRVAATRARALARLNARALSLFSSRTVAALRMVRPLRPVLTHLEPLFELNLAKEIEKDANVFRAAAQLVDQGAEPDAASVQMLLEASRRIDQNFLTRAGAFPVRIVIRYDEVLPFRRRRVERLLREAFAILRDWPAAGSIRAAIRNARRPPELEATLSEILLLYTNEVRMLSQSVQLPLLLVPLRELAAQRLSEVMSEVATRLARDASAIVFRD